MFITCAAGAVMRVWHQWGPVVVIWTTALPLAAVTAVLLARRGTRTRRAVVEVGAVFGTLPWLWMMLTPIHHPRELYLVPFSDVVHLVAVGPTFAAAQVVGNLLPFAALGFLLPVRWRVSPLRVTALAAGASTAVEVAQYVLDIGRVASVDDVLLNALGAGLAAVCSRRWWITRRPSGPGGVDRDHPAPVA